MAVKIVYTAGSGRIRGALTDCDGAYVTPDMVSAIHVNILRKYMGESIPVEGYSGKEIPLSAILDEVKTDHNGLPYNVDFDPYDGANPPYPVRDAGYIVEVIFTSTNGTKSVHQIEVESR